MSDIFILASEPSAHHKINQNPLKVNQSHQATRAKTSNLDIMYKITIFSLLLVIFSTKIVAQNTDSCPESCTCQTNPFKDEINVNCQNAGLTSIPNDIPVNVSVLDLGKNDIRWVDPAINNFSNFTKLQKLYLNDNPKLSFIDLNTFEFNDNLSIVNLDNTGITTFQGLKCTNLQELHLRSDSLKTFDLDGFVSGLQTNTVVNFFLTIGGKNLQEIKSSNLVSLTYAFYLTINTVSDSAKMDITKILAKIPKTRDLILQNIGVAELTFSYPFYDYLENLYVGNADMTNFLKMESEKLPKNLKTFMLQNSGLREIPTEFLENFEKLSVLDLKNNLIENLECANLPIDRLIVEGNPMKTACLKNMGNLQFFLAAGCDFERVPFSTEITPKLVGSEMMKNQLKHLNGSTFPDSFKYFDVSENPFVCDCEDYEHQKYVQENLKFLPDGLKNAYNHECSNTDSTVLDLDYNKCVDQFCSKLTEAEPKCSCRGKIDKLVTDCSGAGLTKIPEEIPAETVILQLVNNDLRWIDQSIYNFSRFIDLENLDLSENSKLSFVDEKSFTLNLKLEEINLDDTAITSFSGFVAPGLKYLSLNSDALESFDMDGFVEKINGNEYDVSGFDTVR